MRTTDDVTADVGERDEVDVASRRTDGGGPSTDPYHSSSDQSFAAIGAYASAQARFSSFWASIA